MTCSPINIEEASIKMLKESKIWNCPFCDKSTIKIILIPRSARPEKSTWGGSRVWMNVTEERIIVQSGCSECGKTLEEVDAALRKGVSKPKSKEELKKQLEELGLLGKFGGKGE